ncbi:3-deoxy-D-manno-octulosonic acid transferase [Flexibacterium corallicola]|uniref:3-deoxy-D-manno-octulosonic acid transferase n=1 Tax=Flexibacterium corallicola TaxID=3037259 RepID=UPI00286F2ED6|nr:3-deoxy-D-manno-octulosonic acid transferase [Pseudovibrio sp. M1P-2-3]
MSSLLLSLYRGLGAVAGPVLSTIYKRRAKRGKEDPSRQGERFGIASHSRPDGFLIWIHAASVGETMAILPLASSLLKKHYNVLLTTGTLTSAETVASANVEGLIHQFVPYDTPRIVQRFLDYWKPELAVTVESEIWPTTFIELEKRHIPLAIINGRISEKSFKSWLFLKPLASSVFKAAKLVLAQSPQDGARFKALGIRQVHAAGNIKFDGASLKVDKSKLAELECMIKGRPVWLAASTHPGEEMEVASVHCALKASYPDLLTIIVPRHPARGLLIREELEAAGLRVAQRSRNETVESGSDVYLADSLGELGIFFKLVHIVFMGGSLVPVGGHNLLEPAQLGCAIISGKQVANNEAVYKAFERSGAVVMISDKHSLTKSVQEFLGDAAMAKAYSDKAQQLVLEGSGALARTEDALKQFLPENNK